MMITKLKAVISLVGGQVSTSDDETFEYNSGQTPPTATAINAELARLIAEYEANDYQRQRAVTYWPLADQLDATYWDKKNGTNVWEQHIEAVKAKFPKP